MAQVPIRFTAQEERFLRRAPVGRIATLDSVDGYPHCVAVDYLFYNGRFYFGSDRQKRKVQNILVDDRVAFEVDVYEPLPTAPTIGGASW